MSYFSLYILIGILAGFLAGLLGIGGGIIAVPGLAATFTYAGMPTDTIMHMAASTSLTAVMFSASVAVLSQHRNQTINWQLFRQIALGITIGTVAGACTANILSSRLLGILFAIFMLFVAAKLILTKKSTHTKQTQLGKIGRCVVGVIIGFTSGLLGIGGGAVAVPIFLRLGLTAHTAAGTSSACVLLLSIVGTISFILTGTHYDAHLPSGSTGYIYWPAVICIATASMIFVPLGTAVARKLSGTTLKRVFAIFLLLVAIEMLIR